MAYPDPPTTPPIPQRGDRATFSARVDAFLTWVAAIVPWIQGYIADFLSSITTLASGGANTFAYRFVSLTSDVDPGPGNISLNNSIQSMANAIRLDNLSMSGSDVSSIFQSIATGTSAVKGYIRLQRLNDPGSWMIFEIVNASSAAGYYNFSVLHKSGSAQSPFNQNDTIAVFLDKTGDSGVIPGATELLASLTVTTPVSAIAFPNIFSSAYDSYIVTINDLQFSASTSLSIKAYIAGVLDNSALYAMVAAGTQTTRSSSSSISASGSALYQRIGGVLRITNVNSDRNKNFIFDGTSFSQGSTTGLESFAHRGGYYNSTILSGFGLIPIGSVTITSGSIKIYGVKNS